MDRDKLIKENEDLEDSQYGVEMEDFFSTTENQYDDFNEYAWNKGEGYKCPNFPIFDENIEGLESGLYMIAGESNGGKALDLNTPILKTNGLWTTIKDIKIGDKVWGDDGKPTTVIMKSDIFTDHKCYRITLDDGSSFDADEDHVWRVFEYFCHKPTNRERIKTTKELLKNYRHYNPDGYPRYKYRIPMQPAIEYKNPVKDLPIPPYILGIWLGDGKASDNGISIDIRDFPEESKHIIEAGGTVGELRKDNSSDFGGTFVLNIIKNEKKIFLTPELKKLNLINNKHIPDIYLHASIKDRMELLKGLMDTDGCVFHGNCEFCQKADSKIHDSFGELLSSLGIKWSSSEKTITLNDKEFYAKRYHFVVSKDNSCFKMSRKRAGLREKLKDRSFLYKTIVDISEIPTIPMQCIQVNNESHCYCVGKNLTITHNTALVQALFLDYALYEPNKLFGIYFSLDDTRNELIPRIIAAHEHIPISVGSKPQRYMNMLEQGLEGSGIYQEWLDKRDNALEWLKSTKEYFKIEDSNKITCGEQIIDYLRKVKIYLETHAPDKKMIVAIDSMSDIRFISKNFKSDKERNDYIARTVKEWTVELDIPIFGTLHLRKIEQNRRPNIADVKESGEYAYEASFLGIIYNDVSRNKQAATIYQSDPDTGEKLPIIELDWAKNKKSSFKNRTYHYFWPSFSDVRECSKEVMDRYNSLIYSN